MGANRRGGFAPPDPRVGSGCRWVEASDAELRRHGNRAILELLLQRCDGCQPEAHQAGFFLLGGDMPYMVPVGTINGTHRCAYEAQQEAGRP